ncbi:MAG: hypothetical protein D6753_12105 [Planctomycetota bacterium]|nr:MAG: hypothetical protein D6753_12105 [Planctomycetota bacterium]
MLILFRCPQGHKIRARRELAGQQGKCPRCGVKLTVPELPRPSGLEIKRDALTESALMRVLGDVPAPPPPPPPKTEPKRYCPRCRHVVSTATTVCGNCKLYVGVYVQPKKPVGSNDLN